MQRVFDISIVQEGLSSRVGRIVDSDSLLDGLKTIVATFGIFFIKRIVCIDTGESFTANRLVTLLNLPITEGMKKRLLS